MYFATLCVVILFLSVGKIKSPEVDHAPQGI